LGIVSKIKNNTILTNIASLGLLQMANYVIPILVIPFVVRALGADGFGKASYAQNIITYLTVLVNFGFDYSATRDIAINKNNKEAIRNIFWSVIKHKGILLIISFIALGVMYFTFPKVTDDLPLYIYAAIVNIGFVFFPTWFFQGIEKMGKMAIFNFVSRAFGGLLVVLLVRETSDYRLYIFLNSIVYVFVGITAFLYVIKKYDLLPYISDRLIFKESFTKSFPIFLNTLCAMFYTIFGMTLLGNYVSDADLGIYAGAYKIIYAFVMLSSMPLSVALYPAMSKAFNESLDKGFTTLKKSIMIVAPLVTIMCAAIYIFSPLLVKLFLGDSFGEAIYLLKLFSPLPLLIIMASFFTVQGLYALKLQKFAPLVGLIVSIFCLLFNLYYIPKLGIKGAVIAYLLSELVEIVISATIILLYKLKCKK
jgi:PST family polysaccharide transporter